MKLWHNYIGKKYLINNPDGKVLQDGDLVVIHPDPSMPSTIDLLNKEIYYGFIETLDTKYIFIKLSFTMIRYDVDKHNLFDRLESVSWWTEEHRTIQSPIFKSLAAMLGIKYESLRGMPGYFDSILNSELPKGWVT